MELSPSVTVDTVTIVLPSVGICRALKPWALSLAAFGFFLSAAPGQYVPTWIHPPSFRVVLPYRFEQTGLDWMEFLAPAPEKAAASVFLVRPIRFSHWLQEVAWPEKNPVPDPQLVEPLTTAPLQLHEGLVLPGVQEKWMDGKFVLGQRRIDFLRGENESFLVERIAGLQAGLGESLLSLLDRPGWSSGLSSGDFWNPGIADDDLSMTGFLDPLDVRSMFPELFQGEDDRAPVRGAFWWEEEEQEADPWPAF